LTRDLEQETRNKALVLEAFDALFNRRDFEAASAVYAALEGLDVLVLDSHAPGGQAGSSSRIENYLGFPMGLSEQELASRADVQAQKVGRWGQRYRADRNHRDRRGIPPAGTVLERTMSLTKTASNTTAATHVLQVNDHSYAYRRFGNGSGLPLLCLQHFTGTLDNWDPAVTDPLASGREVILFDNAGVGRSTGEVPETIGGMAEHPMAFLDELEITTCDVIGYSLGGMVALQMVQNRPSIFRRMILVGTAPRGGEDIMHLEKPSLAKRIQDPTNRGFNVLKKIFFTSSTASQTAGEAFIQRISQRKDDRDPAAGPKVANAQIAAFREWEAFKGERFADLRAIRQPALVVNGVHDEMIAVRNSYWLADNLPNAVLLVYPDAGHGSLFQYADSFTRHAAAFLSVASESAVF
jgi:pimeloyl-ACP methyl ester carboxylesterase